MKESANYHFIIPNPTLEHARASLRLCRWARSHGDKRQALSFLKDASDMRNWIKKNEKSEN